MTDQPIHGSRAAVAPGDARPASTPCTCFKVRSLARRVTQLYDDTLAPSGLRITQYALIAHARRPKGAPAPTVSDLAAALVTDRTTLTRNLRPLIAAGLVRVEAGGDARSKAVRVTDAGEQAYRVARPLWKAAQARVRDIAGARAIGRLEGLADEIVPLLDPRSRARG